MMWLTKMWLQMFTPRDDRDEGATMVEYGLLVAFIALVALVGITVFGSKLSAFFSTLAGKF